MKQLPKFGIALSGGGARGILHIGALEALRKYGIDPEIISGTSAGALVGVLYAAGLEPLQILDLVKGSKMHKMIKWKLPSSGLFDMKKLQVLLEQHIPADDFSALKKPFYCAVTNLNTGLAEIKSSGKLFQWVLASASLPVTCIRDKCRILIGVHVNHNGPEENISGFKAIAERTLRLAFAKNVKESLAICDFVIDPPQTRKFNTFDFGKADEIFEIGFEETERHILELFGTVDLEQVIQEKKTKR